MGRKKALRIDIVTIFPEYFGSPLGVSLIGKAAVRRSAMSRRQRAIAAWWPDSSTSGTSRSRQARGLV